MDGKSGDDDTPFSSNTDYQIRLIVHLWKSKNVIIVG